MTYFKETHNKAIKTVRFRSLGRRKAAPLI